VWRCRVEAPDAASIPSVIVKRFKGELERGFDEWAALAFRTDRPLTPPVAPRFLAGDADARVFVMEDLGAGRTLEDLLQGGDAAAATDALVSVARLAGSLHAHLLDATLDFDRRRGALAPRAASPLAAAGALLRRARGQIASWLRAADVVPAPGLGHTLEAVARAVEHPGAFATLTHGDMAPSNTHITPTRLRLLDFEYAGVRSALYDTLFWTLVCPFPEPLIDRAEAAYRTELMRACPAARDNAAYATERATVAAWRMLNLLQWLPPSLRQADPPWAPGVSARQAVLWHLSRFDALATGVTALSPLVETLARLGRVLGERWSRGIDPTTLWPALRSLSSEGRARPSAGGRRSTRRGGADGPE
jgi:hypothetical protein